MKFQFTVVGAAATFIGSVVAWENVSEVPYYGLSPPVYPSPKGTGNSSTAWAAAYEKANAFVALLELDEKVNLTRGYTEGNCIGNVGSVPRLGFKSICIMDAPAGMRGQEFVSAFPAGQHLASTWDKNYMYRYGQAYGEEFRGKGVNVALGPVSGPLGRMARGGRNWEGAAPDPYLSGIQMGQIVTGIQENGVISTLKHWLFNEQEFRRNPSTIGEAISSNVDDKTAHELYIWPFMDGLRAGAGCVLCGYQRANNSYSCQNSKLINGILKTELGFQGFMISDWQGQHAGVASALAGLDLVMPDGGYWGDNLTEAVTNGSVPLDRLDDMATRLLASYYLLNQDEDFPPAEIYASTVQHPIVDVTGNHSLLIREIGAAGHVLVKNINNTLPLKSPRFVGIFGYDAEVKANPWVTPLRYGGGYDVNFGWNTFNGTLIVGGGSGSNSPPYVISPFHAIQDRVIADHGILRWDFYSINPTIEASIEACLVFINAYASESFDRTTLTDEFSDELVANVASNCANTIVVIHHAGIRVVDAWIDHSNITAVIYAGLPGQESGNSLVDILYGDVNPSGKLPFTVAKNESDYSVLNSSVSFDVFPQSDFSEGVYIDYRAFDRSEIEPRFEFGYGLSYTTFGYSNLSISQTNASTTPFPDANVEIVQGGNPSLWDALFVIKAEIMNTGELEGAEVAQLYLGIPNSPVRQLRGFEKVLLGVGESAEVVFEITRRDLSIWDVEAQEWSIQSGSYGVWIGQSSRILVLNGTIVL